MKKTVLVAMSGGVDSSVAAAILVEQGFEVTGITMKLFDDKMNEITSFQATDDAKKVADILNIPHCVMDLSKQFKKEVIDYFIDEYCKGYTPNPCVACNKHIKFGLILEIANQMGIKYIATGHYAKIEFDNNQKRWLLKRSLSKLKDQTYVLYNMTQKQLAHTLFPLANYENKKSIRELAEKLNLNIANKPDSQDICFINNNYSKYIKNKTSGTLKLGNFVDIKGNILGIHEGIINYTIGQRKGLGIALGKPAYVIGIDSKRNEVIIGEQEQLYSKSLIAKDINLISVEKLGNKIEVTAKIRYSTKEARACISPLEDHKILVEFTEKQRAITPGQSVVFYDGETVIGGGIIEKPVDS